MSEEDHIEESDGRNYLLILLSLPVLVFLPLVLALIENSIAGSNYVEEFFKTIGLHEVLGKIYNLIWFY